MNPIAGKMLVVW